MTTIQNRITNILIYQ